MEFDHAKLVEIPLEHQTPHYNIFTEVLAIPRKSLIPILEYDFYFRMIFQSKVCGMYFVLCLALSPQGKRSAAKTGSGENTDRIPAGIRNGVGKRENLDWISARVWN